MQRKSRTLTFDTRMRTMTSAGIADGTARLSVRHTEATSVDQTDARNASLDDTARPGGFDRQAVSLAVGSRKTASGRSARQLEVARGALTSWCFFSKLTNLEAGPIIEDHEFFRNPDRTQLRLQQPVEAGGESLLPPFPHAEIDTNGSAGASVLTRLECVVPEHTQACAFVFVPPSYPFFVPQLP
jgi:hypothetical protein